MRTPRRAWISKDDFFDYIIDDGPHSFESQEYAVSIIFAKYVQAVNQS